MEHKRIKTIINKRTKSKPITRAELCRITGLSDRAVRNIISELRNDGNWIINRGEGYYRARSQKDREYVIKEYTSRIAKMSIIIRNLNNKSEGQITM